MNDLVDSLKEVQSSTFALYLKCHNYHWNVEGDKFPMYHDFFSDLYTEIHSAVDKIAELIRTLDEYAPGSLNEFSKRTVISDEISVPDYEQMVVNLFSDNQKLLTSLTSAYKLAEKYSEFGISNAIQDRIETHKKYAWMLRATSKGD